MSSKNQKIGLTATTSLVVGNMIGAGIFLLPSVLASQGSISILGWLISAVGALILAKVFSNFSKIIVNKSGGPYTYSREGFGDFIGFLVAWGYWISCWVGNAGIVVAVVSALTVFFPALETDPVLAIGVGLAMIWALTWINSKGVKASGKIQVITTVLKLLPLVFVILIGAFYFNFNNVPAFNLTGESNLTTLALVSTMTLAAFLGLESASIPAENIENPEVTVPKATMLGTLITTAVYILGTIVLFGIVPVDVLQSSPAPFAEAGRIIAGDFGSYFVAAGAAIAAIGALNGWILITSQIPMATAKDKLFPEVFKIENKNGVPIFGLIIGSVLTSLVMLLNFSGGLVKQFEFTLLLTTLTCLVPYVFVMASYIIVIIEKKLHRNNLFKTFLLGGLGFSYSIWAIYGSGHDTVFYGFLLLLAGIPFYALMQWNKSKEK
jgi:APA family basic amino acid/polyamine antiporter